MQFQRTYDEHPVDRDYGPTVLIVDDEEIGRLRLQLICQNDLARLGLRVLCVRSIDEALAVLESTTVHVILLDKHLTEHEDVPHHNGIEAIPRFLAQQPHAQIIVVTGSRDTQDVAKAMMLGAFWFLPKETEDNLVACQVAKAIEVADLALAKLKGTNTTTSTVISFAGRSPAMLKLKNQLQAVAETNRPVLLLGETGCGKTTAAKLIHEYRKEFLKQPGRPLCSVNMAAIPPTLAEGELFGHESGAFTGADKSKPGIFERANNGTLFLDEIGDASLDLQAKILKVIEDGRFQRLGDTKDRTTSFKLVCATNRDLEQMVARGEFREDLYFRISTFPISIPSLAERRRDIPDIIRALLPKCCEDNNVRLSYEDLPQDFIDYLVNAPQRGNVRGIEQQLSRLLVWAPKDRRGAPQLRNWREIPGLQTKRSHVVPSITAPITLKELKTRSLDVVGPGFDGLKALTLQVSDLIVSDALAKHKTGKAAANALKISQAAMSQHLRRMRSSAARLGDTASKLVEANDRGGTTSEST